MKRISIVLVLAIAGLLVVGQADAKKKKKNVGAYLSGSRIAIVEGRPQEALRLLDTLAITYGPHAQALSLSGQVYVDLIDAVSDAAQKKPLVQILVDYSDSLAMCCENEDINKKYRKNCNKYLEKADSTKIKYWREFYNLGVEQLTNLDDLAEDLKIETDSASIAYIERDIQVNIDSVQNNMILAILLDPIDHRPYVAIGNAWERKGDFKQAADWLLKGLEKTSDRTSLLLPIAHNFIKQDDYCGAIPFFKEHCEGKPTDENNMMNLSICYNNCEMPDSAMFVYREMLTINPDNTDVLGYCGRFFLVEAQYFSDSASDYRLKDDMETADKFGAARTEAFDSAQAYFKQAFNLLPDNQDFAEQYSFVSALLEDCESAIEGYEKVAELDPDNDDNWTWLGDCYLRLARYENAIVAYENVVRVKPGELAVWENLADLYQEVGNKTKQDEAQAKIRELSN
ncbi:MAG: tetratricopeptide repeat protein [candidate division Zixibacteria bacterium]|nr:tetratricopeptide repeat protein [candidate division Zixibacteria bacterium]